MATPHNHPHFLAYNQPIHAKPFSFSSQHPNASRDASGPSFIHRCLPHSHRGQRHRKKSPFHLRSRLPPVLVLQLLHGHSNALLRPRIDCRQGCRVGTARIRPVEGEISCFSIIVCFDITRKLTTHPFSSCDGPNNLFSRYFARESIAYETVALEL